MSGQLSLSAMSVRCHAQAMTISANFGTGPGPIAPDGCAVAFYALLPPTGEAEITHQAIPPNSTVLELGCGTGRILRRLAELGHPVVGVDESPDMLAHAVDLDTVCTPIQALDLPHCFDAVLIASTLINTPNPALRAAMLHTARSHTTPGGTLIVQRHPPAWLDTLRSTRVERDGIHYHLGPIYRDGPLLSTTIEYLAQNQRWTHTFTTCRLTDDEIIAALHSAGFESIRWLNEDRSWLAGTAI